MTDQMDRPPPLSDMFISSVDTLRKREISQKIYTGWNERPPLFRQFRPKRQRFWQTSAASEEVVTEVEDPTLLKGMIRQGIPAPLRCALWMSNIIQSTHPNEPLSYAHEYRTLAKVRILDAGYDLLWENNTLRQEDVKPMLFGNTTVAQETKNYPEVDSLWRVLFALHSVLGVVEYAPIVPSIARILLSHQSESYVFASIREQAHHSSWYWATSKSEHIGYQRAFLILLSKFHPHTAREMKIRKVSEKYASAIFTDFFQSILPEEAVLRIMDIYTLEGSKVLFRVGLALAVLFQKQWKDTSLINSGKDWWTCLGFFCTNNLSLNLLIKKAYGVHGKGVRKRFRFPGRPILQRIIQVEDERFWNENQDKVGEAPSVHPLGLVMPPEENGGIDEKALVPSLATSSLVRTKLAEWLPLSLRFTKLDLVFSTNHSGRTLENFYRCCAKSKHTIMLIEPLNVLNTIIGCYASQNWHPDSKVYGDGNCFLFRISLKKEEEEEEESTEQSQCWKWQCPEPSTTLGEEDSVTSKTAVLQQFQVGTRDFISMGGNEKGGAGLRLNEDLTKGESCPATGFENLPLAFKEMFEVGQVEVYQLVRAMDLVPIR